MALIKCPECGKEISDSASACPNCGKPISSSRANKSKSFVNSPFFWILLAIVAFVAYAIIEANRSQMTSDKAKNIFDEAEQNYRKQLGKEDEKTNEYIDIIK